MLHLVELELNKKLSESMTLFNLLMCNVPKWLDTLKNLAPFAARLLMCVWPFWDITH